MLQQVSRPFQARRALLRYLAPRDLRASPVQKTLPLDAFVEWTGYTRKYAIELLNQGKYDQQTIHRRRLPQYRQTLQQALFLAWGYPLFVPMPKDAFWDDQVQTPYEVGYQQITHPDLAE